MKNHIEITANEKAIEYLERLDKKDYSNDLSYVSGGKFIDAIRYITFSVPKMRRLDRYYIMDWVADGSNDREIITMLDNAFADGNLHNVQKNFCYLEPEMQLYGKESDYQIDFNEAQNILLDLIAECWRSYFKRLSFECEFIVEIDYESGRVEFYQVF